MAQPNFKSEEESQIFCKDSVYHAHQKFLKLLWGAYTNFYNEIENANIMRQMDVMRRNPNSVFSEVSRYVSLEMKKNCGSIVESSKKAIANIDKEMTTHFLAQGYSPAEIFSDEEDEEATDEDDFILEN